MAIISPSISVITLNINGLNSIIKRCTVAEQVEKKSKIQQFPGSLVVRAHVQSLVRKLISHKPPKPKKKKKKARYNCIPSARVSLRLKGVYGMKVKVLQKRFHANSKQKRPGVALLGEKDFKLKTTRDYKSHCII